MNYLFGKLAPKIKYILLFALIVSVLTCSAGSASVTYAETTADKLKQAKNELSSLKDEKDKAATDAANLKAEANALEGELKTLNDSLQQVSDELTSLEIQIEQKNIEIEDASSRLDEAIAVKEQQYEDMKLRIRYMYEHSNSDFLTLFLKSRSMSDFLNAVEYIQSISDYDREQLDEYKNTCQLIDSEKTYLENERTQLADLEESKQEKKDELDKLVADTQVAYENKRSEAQSAQNKLDDYSSKIKEMEKKEAELEKKKAEEDKKKKESKALSGGSVGTVTATGSDAAMLAAIIYCEAGGEPYEGMVAVGSVVLNRVASPGYPGTISGVIYQSGQFSPVASGRFAMVLGQGLASQASINAANAVLGGTRNVSALSFRNVNSGIPGTVIGNHVFF